MEKQKVTSLATIDLSTSCGTVDHGTLCMHVQEKRFGVRDGRFQGIVPAFILHMQAPYSPVKHRY